MAAFGASPWRAREHIIIVRGERRCALRIRERRSPPPIGCHLWPASHVMLHWALDSWRDEEGAVVLEIGAGCGLTAIGLALASPPGCVHSVLATDRCAQSLSNCGANVERNGAARVVRCASWDMNDEPPCDMRAVTHVLAADVVYHGAGGQQLVDRLAHLLVANPKLEVALVLVDRFSGGAVAGMSALTGMPSATVAASALDPAIEAFERAAAGAGLALEHELLGDGVARDLTASLPFWERVRWMCLGHWEAMRLYRVRLEPR